MFEFIEGTGPSNVSPQLMKKALAYLSDRAVYPEWYVTFRIERAFGAVRDAKKARLFNSKEVRESVRKAIRALRVIELEKKKAVGHICRSLRELPTEELRKSLEELSDIISAPRGKSGGKKNPGRKEAAKQGYELLRDFGSQPTRTREGAWHELAHLVYDDANVDLFQTILNFQPPNASEASWPTLHEIVREPAQAKSQTGKT